MKLCTFDFITEKFLTNRKDPALLLQEPDLFLYSSAPMLPHIRAIVFNFRAIYSYLRSIIFEFGAILPHFGMIISEFRVGRDLFHHLLVSCTTAQTVVIMS